MNNHDRMNLEFLLSLTSDAEWEAWYQAVSEDDHDYALELLKQARTEMILRLHELEDSVEYEDLSLAKNLLMRYTLNKQSTRNGNSKKTNK